MNAVAQVARGWLGTPYLHQARCRGAGCDCLGLVLGVWEDLGGTVPQLPPYSRDWSEPQGAETLWREAERLLIPKQQPGAGDVLLFRMVSTGVAKHLGIAVEDGVSPRFIHSMSGRGVVETRLTRPWARRLVARFAFPKVGG